MSAKEDFQVTEEVSALSLKYIRPYCRIILSQIILHKAECSELQLESVAMASQLYTHMPHTLSGVGEVQKCDEETRIP